MTLNADARAKRLLTRVDNAWAEAQPRIAGTLGRGKTHDVKKEIGILINSVVKKLRDARRKLDGQTSEFREHLREALVSSGEP